MKIGETFRDVPMNPKNLAVFWIEYIARHGKNALRSPLVNMPWWQVSLLDVYGFIILVILSILFIAKIVVAYSIGFFLSKQTRDYEKVKRK